ncbi:Putative non-specific DNA binding protein [hydrothermal vent metagenome]|uniref:Putative non-specific DNA binding protein n=1 Tax=hydrothermal vent metagenome TaxID=652676 RepID=A0A1W1BIP0_9ZZZZ
MFKKTIITLGFLASTVLYSMSISEINTASKEKLMEIKGIGDKKASAIITERLKGKIISFDDLQKVSGIGKKMVSNIKNDIKSTSSTKSSIKKSDTNTST